MQSDPSQPKAPPLKVEFLSTSSLHLATLLGTLGIKPQNIVRSGDKTVKGHRRVTWTFDLSPFGEEAIGFWQAAQRIEEPLPDDAKLPPLIEWEKMSPSHRRSAINLVHAFAGNLRHFLGHIHSEGAK